MTRLLLVLTIITLMGASCQDQARTALRRSQIARDWVDKHQDSIVTWRLANIYDPYQQGYDYPGDSANPEFLELAGDGTFHQHDSAQQSFGRWFINPDQKMLALVYEVRNNALITKANPKGYTQTYTILSRSKDSLMLQVPGRHGPLHITYLRDTDHPASHSPTP